MIARCNGPAIPHGQAYQKSFDETKTRERKKYDNLVKPLCILNNQMDIDDGASLKKRWVVNRSDKKLELVAIAC